VQALFPSSFEDGVPRGWGFQELESLVEIKGGKQLSTKEVKNEGRFAVYGANGIMGYSEVKSHPDFIIAFGRVGAYCGSIHYTYDGAWINNNAASIKPLKFPEYILQVLLEADFTPMRTGSAQPFIPNSSLARLPVLKPTDLVVERFCTTVYSLRLRMNANDLQSRALASARDSLLSKLLSGELEVRDVQDSVEVVL
jgi:type I restriction enzyme, S subunit